jgi:pimeloyl-ACP methyl ester carboxylesterase/lysophospholipase L1-like esterase
MHLRPWSVLFAVVCALASVAPAAEPFAGQKSQWNGFDRYDFQVDGKNVLVVVPKEAAQGKPWVWHGEFFGHKPAPDIALLKRGFHVVYMSVPDMLGGPPAVKHWNAFYQELTEKHGFSKKAALVGLSRGGLYCYNWAAANPDCVACIYADAPVCDFKSWPMAKGVSKGRSPRDVQFLLEAYGFKDEAEALAYDKNPVDNLEPLAKAKVPLLHVYGDADDVVPWEENTKLIAERYRKLGGQITIIRKPGVGHHPHGLEDPTPIVEFIAEHAAPADHFSAIKNAKRIVFLGDSITAAGQYVAYFDAWLQTQKLAAKPAIVDCGLPSETVSGLSEAGHAGGQFPRPDLNERLDRVLDLAKPDLVIACYGINCGIYQPFDQERFAKYQDGIANLKKKVEARGAKLILMTPPLYDDQRAKNGFSYNEVLDRYADWLLSQRANGWPVIDLHRPMASEVTIRRWQNKDFTLQPDAVHPNEDGHWFIAQQIIAWCGDRDVLSAKSPAEMLEARRRSPELLPLVSQRMSVLRDAYVFAAGHKRPGVAKGLPVAEAEKKAAELTEKMETLK